MRILLERTLWADIRKVAVVERRIRRIVAVDVHDDKKRSYARQHMYSQPHFHTTRHWLVAPRTLVVNHVSNTHDARDMATWYNGNVAYVLVTH